MATTAARPRSSPEKAHKPAAARNAPARAKGTPRSNGASGSEATRNAGGPEGARKASGPDAARKAGGSNAVAKASKELVKSASPKPSSLKGKAALKLAKAIAHRTLGEGADALAALPRQGLIAGAQALGSVRERAITAASTSADVEATKRPPIQCAVDAGVPIAVAWAEWIRLEWLPEGVDRVTNIKRKRGGRLTGRLRDAGDHRWTAEVLDEREQESFAWESEKGSDCAGLITFYALGERLTRIELTLDVHPVGMAQAVALSTRLADRRAAADLRRFKARLELITPDVYAEVTGESD
jgi:uncharacterized membrane protein